MNPSFPTRRSADLEDEVVPAIISDEPIGGGEIDPDCPFFRAHLAFEARYLDRGERAHVHALSHRVHTAHDSLPGVCGDYSAKSACRSEEHTSELQSLMRNSYAVFCLNKKKT